MKKIISIYVLPLLLIFAFCQNSYAFSTRHHIINIGKNIFKAPLSILDAAFIKGPRAIKEIYRYEVYGSEDPEKNGLFYKKIFAVWSAPPAEAKAIIDGTVEGVSAIGDAVKNLLSIFASD
ncbi:MAG: hypothetical protein KJ893_01435 [Candidatus Omnitrophica bacterium]|nr:hypothetical protein [Candidatus Omnitrophota bacterium]MBU4479808.1 hypothetical protein [Candidatus Omnitrophota bacterium]